MNGAIIQTYIYSTRRICVKFYCTRFSKWMKLLLWNVELDIIVSYSSLSLSMTQIRRLFWTGEHLYWFTVIVQLFNVAFGNIWPENDDIWEFCQFCLWLFCVVEEPEADITFTWEFDLKAGMLAWDDKVGIMIWLLLKFGLSERISDIFSCWLIEAFA